MARYDIYFENKPVGTACVETVGLYTQFYCQCNFCKKGIYRITAQYGMLSVDLGLCIPENNAFVTHARVATKKLNDETPRFFVTRANQQDGVFIPLDPNNKFAYIAKITGAKLRIKNGVQGVLIKNVQD